MGWPHAVPSLIWFLILQLLAVGIHVYASRNSAFIGYTEKQGAVAGTKLYDTVRIASAYGQFVIRLRRDLAPETCSLVWELAQKANCPSCNWYRHEPTPQNWSVNGYWGPPYALMQGSLKDLAHQPPFENAEKRTVKRGDVCIIPGCSEFFIATADHPEWGAGSHIIFGEVESLDDEPKHPFEPYTTNTNGAITTRWLKQPFPFNLTVVQAAVSAAVV